MEEKQKVFIRGRKGRGNEIKDILTGLGATATDISFSDDEFIYFINHHNKISLALVGSEVARIIMDNYKEIKLPRRQWKDGDVLISNNFPDDYAMFKKYNGDDIFDTYFILANKTVYLDANTYVKSYHLSSAEEREKVFKACYAMAFKLLAHCKNVENLRKAKDYLDNEIKRLEEGDD